MNLTPAELDLVHLLAQLTPEQLEAFHKVFPRDQIADEDSIFEAIILCERTLGMRE